MNRHDAEHILGTLVGGTAGWSNATDETFQLYTRHIEQLDDPTIARHAVDQIVATWDEQRRPPIAHVRTTYREHARRQALEQPTIRPYIEQIAVPEGRKIAARAYTAECERHGRQPNMLLLDAMLGLVPGDDPK